MDKHKIRIEAVRREPVDLDRLAVALLALARQLAEEEQELEVGGNTDTVPGDEEATS